MSPEQMTQLQKITDTFRYATTIVGIGPDPDNPERAFGQIVAVPGRNPICLLQQAQILREMADKMDAAHAAGMCSA